jgi:hypothetical protein
LRLARAGIASRRRSPEGKAEMDKQKIIDAVEYRVNAEMQGDATVDEIVALVLEEIEAMQGRE